MPRVSMAEASKHLEELRPFHTSGSLRGYWERASAGNSGRFYVVKSYGETLAKIAPASDGILAELETGYARNEAQARHIRMITETLARMKQAT